MKQGTKFTVPIYGVKVRVFEGDPGQVAQELGIECEGGNPEIGQCDGAVFNHHNGSFTLVVNLGTPVGRVVIHEIHHLTDCVMSFVGVNQEVAGEAHAYLMGWLTDKIIGILGKNK